ncbi:hypothetical protein OUZ56_028518 [Daphnia magna]|uniref:Uncharacterized protein n=1 Tax=Daphnia magna TaxID=35525 RepID=A0ABR0B491_9CRUS|nr:hypothetical protein OUZ56_028518 [Daphnia magna]
MVIFSNGWTTSGRVLQTTYAQDQKSQQEENLGKPHAQVITDFRPSCCLFTVWKISNTAATIMQDGSRNLQFHTTWRESFFLPRQDGCQYLSEGCRRTVSNN